MLEKTEIRLMDAVVEQEAGDFLRAMKCKSVRGSKNPFVSLAKFSEHISSDTIYQLYTEIGEDHFHVRFKRSTSSQDTQEEELIRLTLDATHALCVKIAESFDSIEERRLMTLPLYQDAYEELRRCPEEVATWILEKGIRYHAAKNFLQCLN